jgi:HSP20 family protein
MWSPIPDLDTFGDAFAGWPFRGRPSLLQEDMWGPGRRFAPAVDVTEDDDEYTVTAELPGIDKKDVTIELHEGMLTIRGEKRSEREEESEQRRHVERCFGTFSRSFSLPPDADGEHVKANFENGVLRVKIPKTEEAKPRTVDIKG